MRPNPVCKGLTFIPVPKIGRLAQERDFFNRDDLPDDIPQVFVDLAHNLFFEGGQCPVFHPEVNRVEAFRALNLWLSSFAPPHESKIATVAYALWAWSVFDETTVK